MTAYNVSRPALPVSKLRMKLSTYKILQPYANKPWSYLSQPTNIFINRRFMMRAWDTANSRYCFWTTTFPWAAPQVTSPVSIYTNLTNISIINTIV
jgi:hypothetical protein